MAIKITDKRCSAMTKTELDADYKRKKFEYSSLLQAMVDLDDECIALRRSGIYTPVEGVTQDG